MSVLSKSLHVRCKQGVAGEGMQGDEDTPVAPVNPVAPVPPASFQEGVSVEQQPPCALQAGRGWRRHARG